jgi:hypothetical protein
MEPNKVDKIFRKSLQDREINPTPAAWDRLDAMLTVAEEKKAGTTYNWLYIAATIIGFIAIAIVFFSKTQPLEDVRRNEIVYENEAPMQGKDSIQDEKQKEILVPETNETIAESTQNKPTQSINKNQTNFKNNPIERKSNNQTQPELQPANEAVANNQSPERQRTNQAVINQKTEQSDQLSNPIANKPSNAIATLDSNPKLGKTPIKVNASNLLSEVDGELELSFREKVINKIDKNYKTVKVALANRNQQNIINQN